jgi:hypothetical protein
MEFTNSAIIYDDTLLEIVVVLEHKKPAGPSFLHALNILIEAVTIHDQVFYDPRHTCIKSDNPRNTVEGIIADSPFIDELVRAECLKPFPAWSTLEEQLQKEGNDYSEGRFLADAIWQLDVSFTDDSAHSELNRYRNLLDLMELPDIFSCEYMFESSDEFVAFESLTVPKAMIGYGFTEDDIRLIDGMNHRAKAFVDLGRIVGLNAYPPLTAIPHQIGAIRASNSRAKIIYDELKSKVFEKISAADNLGTAPEEFHRVPVPPLSAVLLDRCKDSRSALGTEIVRMREDHRELRRFLTQFEADWKQAKTKIERLEMLRAFDNAWKALVQRVDRPATRLIYRIWNYVKKPQELLVTVGDSLVEEGQRRHAIERVAGMNDYWNTVSRSPVADLSRTLLANLLSPLAPDEVWDASIELSRKIDRLSATQSNP